MHIPGDLIHETESRLEMNSGNKPRYKWIEPDFRF